MRKTKNNMAKKALSLTIVLVLMLSIMIPVWAEGEQPDVSAWAVSDLNEGEKYGIYPMEWYYDQFKGQITEAKLDALVEKVDAKIDFVADKVDFQPVKETGKLDRNDVLTRLYNVLASYNLAGKGDVVTFMQTEGIVNGTGNGLFLDKSCNSEQAVIFAVRTVQHAYDALEAGGKGVFWKIEKNGNTVYLLGSIHIGNSSVYPLNDMVTDAFKASEALYVEADILNSQEGLNYFMAKGQYADGTTIKDHVSAAQYDKIVKACEVFEITPDQIATFKPWFLANQLSSLSMMMGADPSAPASDANLGVDVYFTLNALLSQKPIVELEGIPFQADMFDGLSLETQTTYLEGILDSILTPVAEDQDTSADLLVEWLEYWRSGDLESFQTSFQNASTDENAGDSESEFSKMLFGKRDINMAARIDEMLKAEGNHTYFVVVGAGHYMNKNGVIDLLKEKGYEVEWMY